MLIENKKTIIIVCKNIIIIINIIQSIFDYLENDSNYNYAHFTIVDI